MTQVKLTTNHGEIVIELNAEKAPITVTNFIEYVERWPLRKHRFPPRHR